MKKSFVIASVLTLLSGSAFAAPLASGFYKIQSAICEDGTPVVKTPTSVSIEMSNDGF